MEELLYGVAFFLILLLLSYFITACWKALHLTLEIYKKVSNIKIINEVIANCDKIWNLAAFCGYACFGCRVEFITRLQHSIVETNSRMALLVETGPVNKFNNLIIWYFRVYFFFKCWQLLDKFHSCSYMKQCNYWLIECIKLALDFVLSNEISRVTKRIYKSNSN